MHSSIKMNVPCEPINITPLNPLISKCQIKVCYVGDEPNRNKSIITKETARQLANSLPGSPIVGYYNELEGDFEEHNREIHVSNGKFKVTDSTKPYGFVDLGAKVWFQKFLDDGVNEREYLMTEGYLWTGQYPEARRIVEKGNNQSMELDDKTLNAHWTKDNNGKPKFFIINEAIISKLCVLGENCEPCFEGSNITDIQFSFEDNFTEQLFSMMNELKDLLTKGGTKVFTTYAVKIGDSLWSALYSYMKNNNFSNIEAVLEDGEQKFAVLKNAEGENYRLNFSIMEDNTYSLSENAEKMDDYVPAAEPQFALAEVEAFELKFKKADKKSEEEDKKDESDNKENEDSSENKDSNSSEEESKEEEDKLENEDKDDENKKKKKEYSLEEIPEYLDLSNKFSDLESKYNALVAEKEQMESQLNALKDFKLKTERVQKKAMIDNTFFMLSDDDKKDVIDNIDTYSLEEIEAKLSVICVRNKVNFAALEDLGHEDPMTYNLNGDLFQGNDDTPDWVKAVLQTQKNNNN